jgi:hypothetical protein
MLILYLHFDNTHGKHLHLTLSHHLTAYTIIQPARHTVLGVPISFRGDFTLHSYLPCYDSSFKNKKPSSIRALNLNKEEYFGSSIIITIIIIIIIM